MVSKELAQVVFLGLVLGIVHSVVLVSLVPV